MSTTQPEKAPIRIENINGHHHVKRALEVSAAGGHHILMTPTTTPAHTQAALLARALHTILPEPPNTPSGVPFYAPDASCNRAALLGNKRPGLLSCASEGVFFIPHVHMFGPRKLHDIALAIDVGGYHHHASNTFHPISNVTLVALAMPCPCGDRDRCICSRREKAGFASRIPWRFVEACQIFVDVPHSTLPKAYWEDTTEEIRARVRAVRAIQAERGMMNSRMTEEDLRAHCKLDQSGRSAFQWFQRTGRTQPNVMQLSISSVSPAPSPISPGGKASQPSISLKPHSISTAENGYEQAYVQRRYRRGALRLRKDLAARSRTRSALPSLRRSRRQTVPAEASKWAHSMGQLGAQRTRPGRPPR